MVTYILSEIVSHTLLLRFVIAFYIVFYLRKENKLFY
jgi:hypothetical protein